MPESYANLKGYSPDEDSQFGISSTNFPITFYDRPSTMLANLLRGDVDGMTRAMLSPDTLTPTQVKNVTDMLTKGKKPSPVMKTILDVATNPLVIIGLIMSLKYPMGSSKVLLDIRKGLLPKSAAFGKLTGGMHGALMKLATVPEAFETLFGITRETEKYMTKYGSMADDIFKRASAGKAVSKWDSYLVAARLDGLHKPGHYMVKALQNEPEYIAFMGGKDVPIAANIQNAMDSRLISLSDKLKGWYKEIRGTITSNEKMMENVNKALEKKGWKAGKDIDDYWPHRGGYSKYQKTKIRAMNKDQYHKFVKKDFRDKVGREEIDRLGGMFPEENALRALEETGAIKPGFMDNVIRPIMNRWATSASVEAGKIWDDVVKLNLDEVAQRREFTNRMTEYFKRGAGKHINFLGRVGSEKTARETLDAMAMSLQDAGVKGGTAVRDELFEIGKVLSAPPEYSMNVWETTQGYLNSVAKDYAWHGTGLGNKMGTIIDTPGIFRHAPHLESYLVDGLLPHIRGYNSYAQMQKVMNDSTYKSKILNWVKSHPMVEQTLGKNHKEALVDWLSKPGTLSSQSIGGQVANWFHLSTLGLNMSATSANSMQTFITTINQVGPRGIWRGLKGYAGEPGLIQRAEKYMGLVAKGASKPEAWKQAFPEFIEEMGEWSKTTERLLSGDVAQSGLLKMFKDKGVWEKVKGAMMLPFSTAEAGNQLLSFYSGRYHHLYQNAGRVATEGAKLSAEANKVGGSLSLLTQFAGGPLGIPSGIMNMNPMWRQYMHFPMRYLAYLHGSLRMGIDPSKMDWGTIGRALAGSTAMYIAGRNMLGMDLSRGLMVGALPLPGYEKAPFYPFPFVPPVAGIMGELGRAALTGEPRQLSSVGAMMVPGGIALQRAYRSMSPKYADYENPTQEGRIPLYNRDKALVGTLSPMELTLRAVGLRPMGVTSEQGAAKWILSQRDRIRKYRREYIQALFENDTQKAEKINQEFQKVYPELGELQVKKTDITALENRREMSRIHRITRGISKSYRPIFEQVIGTATLSRLSEDIEMGGAGALENYFPNQ